MKNAFSRFGYTCASILLAGGLATAVAAVETKDLASVTLPHEVMVASAKLPAGHYTISSEGDGAFLIQSDNGQHEAVFLGWPIESETASPKTEVVLAGEGNSLRLDKLFIEGETTGYEFQP